MIQFNVLRAWISFKIQIKLSSLIFKKLKITTKQKLYVVILIIIC